MFATIPDLLRLVAVPFFGYVAYRDVETRRIPNRTWYPLAALAVILLVWDAYRLFAGDPTVAAFQRRRFLVGVAFSLLFIVPLVYGFWLVGGFGGADVKAFWVIALLFPVFPAYNLWELGVGLDFRLPYVRPELPVFSLTILSNTVVAGIFYPVALAVRNAAAGYVSPGMFIAKPVDSAAVGEEYGTLLEFPDRSLTADLSLSGLRAYFSWRGLDLDALRMYLQWRGLTLAEVRENPERYRDPATLPVEPNDPGDGAITDGGTPAEPEMVPETDAESADPWGAAAFLDDIEGSAYGTTPESLREGLDALVGEDVVWISPGIPFLVPLFVGLCLALTAGDLLFAVLTLVGLV
ncbi:MULTISPECIES: A24 family peptidase [Salinibaculum]|uniref:A24 family peptidase n=1 Tax=Salinibaculum TaxID=2732368 RepID=UPI0030D0834D